MPWWPRPDGSVQRYAKIHPFSYAGEHERYAAGGDFLTVDIGGLRTASFVCYDLRFADEFWALAPGTDLYVVLANWPARGASTGAPCCAPGPSRTRPTSRGEPGRRGRGCPRRRLGDHRPAGRAARRSRRPRRCCWPTSTRPTVTRVRREFPFLARTADEPTADEPNRPWPQGGARLLSRAPARRLPDGCCGLPN